MEAASGAPALLSPSNLRLCFVTRSQALAIELLEAALLREAGEGAPAAQQQQWPMAVAAAAAPAAAATVNPTWCKQPFSSH